MSLTEQPLCCDFGGWCGIYENASAPIVIAVSVNLPSDSLMLMVCLG